MPPLFIPQASLEQWIEEGKVAFHDGVMMLIEAGTSQRLTPAVRVFGVLDGSDVQQLVGTVRTLAALEAAAAEHLADSLIVGDTAYQCEEGYIVAETSVDAATGADAGVSQRTEDKGDEELLSEFLLKHLL
jgi:hypothetical protein